VELIKRPLSEHRWSLAMAKVSRWRTDQLRNLTEAATKVFGSGWAFLATDPKSWKLEVMSFPNQDSPLLNGKAALLACDVWEHSYYLKYQNRRPDYLKAWWNVVQWDAVNSGLQLVSEGIRCA
jgi:superoxide dismutase, Fe-Mn family